MDLKRVLRSVGKRCFRNCYKIAAKKGDDLTPSDLLEHDKLLVGTKETGLRTRVSCIKRIFRKGLQDQALTMANGNGN